MDRKQTFAPLCFVRKGRMNRKQKYPVYVK